MAAAVHARHIPLVGAGAVACPVVVFLSGFEACLFPPFGGCLLISWAVGAFAPSLGIGGMVTRAWRGVSFHRVMCLTWQIDLSIFFRSRFGRDHLYDLYTTFSDGCLGSNNDEGRSEV